MGRPRSAKISEEVRRKHHADVKAWKTKNPVRARAHSLLNNARWHAKKIGVEFDPAISLGLVLEALLMDPKCDCCRRPFAFVSNHFMDHAAPSIDRFDSLKGYTIENINFICWRCNNLKRDASVEELEVIVQWMKRNQ